LERVDEAFTELTDRSVVGEILLERDLSA